MSARIFPLDTGLANWNDGFVAKWDVQQAESASGLTRAIVEQDLPKYEFSVKFNAIHGADIEAILGFYNLCKGQLLPFFIKLADHCSVKGQLLARGSDGKYQLVKSAGGYVEPVLHADKIKVYVNGTETSAYTYADGKLSLTASGEVTADYEYYERVRFGDQLSYTQIFANLYSCSIKVVTAR